jgi:hypothetical protein
VKWKFSIIEHPHSIPPLSRYTYFTYLYPATDSTNRIMTCIVDNRCSFQKSPLGEQVFKEILGSINVAWDSYRRVEVMQILKDITEEEARCEIWWASKQKGGRGKY